nr:hypothetical protein [Tanacetum cinerariifolium]
MVAASKVFMLKPVIENGATLPKTQAVDGIITVMPITIAEEKAQRRLEVKAISTLMLGIPNEHQLKFNSIKDAKQLLEDVEKRFKWNTHVVVWRNKADLDTMSMDDLYNNLKVYEPEVKGLSSSNSNTQNMVFLSSANSGNNGAVNTAQTVNTANGVSTASTQVNVDFVKNIDNLSDAVICVFLAIQLNSPQLAHEDLDQIHPYDMEEMDLRWQMAMLTMRARSEEESKAVRKNNDSPIIEEWVSDDEEENVTQLKIRKKTVNPSIVKKEFFKPRQQEKTARKTGNPQMDLQDKGVIDSGCSRHMTENMSYLTNYEEINGGYVAFGENPKGGKITKKLIDESQVLLRVPRKKNMYSVDLKNIVSKEGLTSLFAKTTSDESKLCHRRPGHLNFETMNKLVKGNLVRGTKDETNGILKSFITRIENLVNHKVKVIRCDNRTEFKNKEMNQFCEMKEAVNTACYVQNKVLVVKPHSKTLYELFHVRTRTLSFIRPFGCPVTILNTKDHLGKFDSKADEGLFVGYSLNSKASRVFNSITRIVEENLYIRFTDNTPNVAGSRPDWLFDIDALTRTMNYELIVAGTQSNGCAGIKASNNAGQARKERENLDDGKKVDEDPSKGNECYDQEKKVNVNNTNNVNTVSSIVYVVGTNRVNVVGELLFDPDMSALEDVGTFDFSNEDKDDDAVADMNNLDTTIQVSPTPTTRIHKDHPLDQDERGIVIRNKARLVAQGHTQKEGIGYDEVFAPVARIEAIRLFLAYASFKDFVVYQMDVKSVLLYGKIEEEVYVCQPPGFEDPDFPDRVYKTMDFKEGKLKRPYSSKGTKMSSMREFTFFLGLQVNQKNDGVFISQDKYVARILKKFEFIKVKNTRTPIETQKPLLKDEDGEEVDFHMYRYQVNPKVSHLYDVKRNFRYLKGQPKLSLWYLKDSLFDLVAYTDSDYAGASLDRKSTTEEQFRSTVVAKTINEETQIHGKVDGKKVIIFEASRRRDLRFVDEAGVDSLPNSTIFEQLASMDLKTTTWNEFSSTVASAIICLATNQKFNFSKWIFDYMGRNLDNMSGKLLMYLRFIQVILDKQIDGMSNHKRKYISPSHTKKFFRNMRRIKKCFSGRITPLFLTMVVQSQLGKGLAIPTDPHHIPTILQTSSSQLQKTHKPGKPKRKNTQVPQPGGSMEHVADEAVYKELDDRLVRAATTTSSLEVEQDSGNINKTQSNATPNESSSQGTNSGGGPKCQEVIRDTITQTRVINLEKTKTNQANEIDSLKKRVKKIERRNKSRTYKLKRLYKVGLPARVESSDNEESLGEEAFKQERRIDNIDADEDITLVSVQANVEMFDADKDLGNNPRVGGAARYGGAQNRAGDANPGQARQIKCYNCNGLGHIARNYTQPKRPQNFDYFKNKMLLMQAQENGVALDEDQLLFLAGGQDNATNEDVDEQPVQDLALNVDNMFQADDCDAFDYDEQVKLYERQARFELTEREQKIDEQLRIVISDRNLKEETLKKELHSVKLQLASTINHNKLMNLIKPVKRELHQLGSLKGKGVLNKPRNVISRRFTKMHVANTIVEARCLELEAELSNLRNKSHNDNHNELVNRFSNIEVHHLNMQLKYQNLIERFGNNPPTPAKDTSDFDSVFVIEKMKASLQGKDNIIKQLKKQITQLQETYSEADCTLNFRALDSQITQLTKKTTALQAQNDLFRNNREAHLDYLRHLKESVETICKIVEEAKFIRPLNSLIVSACRYTKHSQELLEYTIGTCIQDSHQQDKKHAPSLLIRKKQVTFAEQCCSKHMTRDRSWLMNFVKKFIRTIRFGNDHFGAIMGYEDYVIGESVISKHSCYFRDTDGVELIKGSRGSNLYTISVEDMMKSSLIYLFSKASKNKSWLWHRRLNHMNFGTINDLARKYLVRGLPRLKFEKDHLCSACQLGKSKKHTHKPKTENTNLEVLNTLHIDLCGPMQVQTINGKKYILVIIDDYSRFTWVKILRSKDETPEVVIKFLQQIQVSLNKTTVLRTLQQNDVVKRWNGTLVEAARTMLIFSKASIVFGALCYTTNDSKDLGKLQPTADIGIFVGYAPSRKGLVPNPIPTTPYVPPINKDMAILFQPVFDEYLEPPRVERPISPAPAVQVLVNLAGTPSSTTIDQDAPSPSISPSSSALQSLSLHQGITAESTLMKDNPVAPVDNNPFINVFALEPSSDASSSGDELVPQPDCVMIIALKWIYKVKLDEYGDILKNKARLVAKGYRQEEGIDFEESFASVLRIDAIRIFITNAANTMADVNVNSPAEQAPTMTPPTCIDD